MRIQLSPFPSPRRTLPALAIAVAIAFVAASAAMPAAGSTQDASAFTGRYESGVPVYRLAPVAVSASRDSSLEMAARSGARAMPHVDVVAECTGAPS